MAAVLGDGPLRRSSLLGLAALARSPAEERKFRSAAFLYDPDHDATILASLDEPKFPGQVGRQGTTGRAALRPAIGPPRPRLPGQGSIEKPAVREQVDALARILTAEELLAACTTKDLKDEQLYKLLQAETAIELSDSAASSGTGDIAPPQTSWTAAVNANGLTPLPSLVLDSLTEFDPRACLFRDGKWVKP